MLTTILLGVGGVVVILIAATAAWAGVRAAPFLPTRQRDVERLIAAAHIQAQDRVVDLGAGDGRLVVAAAQQAQAQAVGYEISFLPFLVARWRLWRARLGNRARIEMKDFFRVPLSSFDVVVCFLTPGPMQRLRTKLETELRPGTRVVSYVFPITGWEPERVDKPNDQELSIFVYRKPS